MLVGSGGDGCTTVGTGVAVEAGGVTVSVGGSVGVGLARGVGELATGAGVSVAVGVGDAVGVAVGDGVPSVPSVGVGEAGVVAFAVAVAVGLVEIGAETPALEGGVGITRPVCVADSALNAARQKRDSPAKAPTR